MPQRQEHQKSDDAAVEHESPRLNILQFPSEKDEGLDLVSRWVNLADQVLGNGKRKKKA